MKMTKVRVQLFVLYISVAVAQMFGMCYSGECL